MTMGSGVMNMITCVRPDGGLLTSGVPIVWFVLQFLFAWSLVTEFALNGETSLSQIRKFRGSGPH